MLCVSLREAMSMVCVFVPSRSVRTVDGTIFKALNCRVSTERLRVLRMCIMRPIRRSNGLNVAPIGTYLFVFILNFGPKTMDYIKLFRRFYIYKKKSRNIECSGVVSDDREKIV